MCMSTKTCTYRLSSIQSVLVLHVLFVLLLLLFRCFYLSSVLYTLAGHLAACNIVRPWNDGSLMWCQLPRAAQRTGNSTCNHMHAKASKPNDIRTTMTKKTGEEMNMNDENIVEDDSKQQRRHEQYFHIFCTSAKSESQKFSTLNNTQTLENLMHAFVGRCGPTIFSKA